MTATTTAPESPEEIFWGRLRERAGAFSDLQLDELWGTEIRDVIYDLAGDERAATYNAGSPEAESLLLADGYSLEEIAKMDDLDQLEALDQIFSHHAESLANGSWDDQARFFIDHLGQNSMLEGDPDPVEAANEVADAAGIPDPESPSLI